MSEHSFVNRRPKYRGIIVIMIVSLALGMFFFIRSCHSGTSPVSANVLLEKNGKNYLFSALGSFVVKDALKKGGSPQMFDSFLVYQDDSEYFLVPSTIQNLAAMASGEYELHTFKEGAIDGYVTAKNEKSFAITTKFKTTAKLGEQDMVNTVVLKNSKGAELKIEWTLNSKRPEYSKLKNCEMHSFWIESSPAPGETVYSTTEYLVVPLKTLAAFFDRKMSFDPETNLLTIAE